MTTTTTTYFTYPTPHGLLTIQANKHGVTHVIFGAQTLDGNLKASAFTNQASTEILEYFAGKRTAFEVPLCLLGTQFQKEVWAALQRIPYATGKTTKQVGEMLGRPEAYRSIGIAIRQNPLAILIPDHRVVGKNGIPVGQGTDAALRRALFAAEQRTLCLKEHT